MLRSTVADLGNIRSSMGPGESGRTGQAWRRRRIVASLRQRWIASNRDRTTEIGMLEELVGQRLTGFRTVRRIVHPAV